MPDPDSSRAKAASTWPLLWETLRAQRRNLLIGTLIGLAWSVGKIASPLLIRYGIDRGIDEGEWLWLWVALIAIAGMVAGFFTALRRFFAFREARWTEARLRERLFSHIMSLHIGYHDRAQTGQLMSRSSSDLNQIQMFVVMIPITLSNLAMVTAVTVILLVTDWVLALLALASLPLIQVAGRRFSRSIHPAVLAVQAEQAELATVVEESVGGVRVIKGFGAEAVQAEKLRTEADDIRRESIEAARIRAKFLPAMELLPQVGLIAVLWFGGNQVIDGDMTLGTLVLFNVFVALLVFPLRMIGMTLAFAQRAAVALGRVNEVLDISSQVQDPERPESLPTVEGSDPNRGLGAVSFREVSFAYPADVRPAEPDNDAGPVLDGFDLVLRPGESVAIVGATGSGKSTVARLLVRFYDADSGSISIDGVDVRSLTLHDLRRAVGIVFEDTLLFHDTVRANIAFADPDADQERVERAARLAGAHDFVMGLPDAYDTMLGERGFSLSGGQRQRIAIARAILADPRILVLDDATSAVDPSKEHEIRSAMSTVMDGRTTIVIAHRPGTIALADTVVLLDGGRVVARGPHADLLVDEPRYRDVLAAMDADADAEADEAGGRTDLGSPVGGD
ncbi:ABC transporter ATP-binding protein [Ilumatobacter nonamiensis]|uniref:ABC transporter ATP-binding protein n=1 Tax=Ilumatobacter nonamiensis TaxID=467093 RepID=UPI00034DF9BB|nr:ABC transporter ATP-binding protein [Ilumatobacter nonamiensis]